MSHFKERKQKNCLNCNAEVLGKYCHICGQENVEPKQSIGHLISHFFNDVTHFDGKFFSTLGYLIRRPGVLTAEYVRGRRASYLDPVRMYIFTSAVFFLIFFNRVHIDKTLGAVDRETIQQRIEAMNDSTLRTYSVSKYDSVFSRKELIRRALQKDSANKIFNIDGARYANTAAYDSSQQTLPAGQRDGFYRRYTVRTILRLQGAYQNDPKHFFGSLINRFFHFLPQILFVSLPLFALLQKFIYLRRKQFYYTDHLIFSIHLYIYTLISILVIFALKSINLQGLGFIDFLQLLVLLGIYVYQYKSMRYFYQQRRLKTVLKFMLLNVMASVLMMILGAIFFIFSSATFE